jgi:hypothetical protein
MITLTPKQVKERFGPLFCHHLLVMIDEKKELLSFKSSASLASPSMGITRTAIVQGALSSP